MADFIWLAIAVAIGVSSPIRLCTQTPFECNGRLFRVIEKGNSSVLQDFAANPTTIEAEMKDLASFDGEKINAICYRSSDNLIYGLLLEDPYVLCRIDGAYNLERLKELPLPTNLTFVAGDISPDGRFLVLLGFSSKEPINLLAKVDLSAPNYPTEMIPLTTTDGSPSVACVDIAFHPTTNILYGFNHKDHRLITIDIANRSIDNESFPPEEQVKGNVPSIFFDAYGNLFGVGSIKERGINRHLLKFNLESGNIRIGQDFGLEGNQDGCSCPYTVDLLNSFTPNEISPCLDTEIQLVVINKSPFDQFEVLLVDTLPNWMEIYEITNPFEAETLSGIGSNIFILNNMYIPIGIDTITLKVRVNKHAPTGTFQNQAYLKNIFLREASSNSITVPSDDPSTPVFDDPTHFSVENLRVNFQDSINTICEGENLKLNVRSQENLNYKWSTGETSPQIEVNQPGRYEVSITSGCQQAKGHMDVQISRLNLELGKDLNIEEGEQIFLEPSIQTNSEIQIYFWDEIDNLTNLSCRTCPKVTLAPHESTSLALNIQNEEGCTATDSIKIKVHPFTMYAPNAFSPNFDNKNDVFFLQGRTNYFIRSFQVFDRWGNLVFEKEHAFANMEAYGWDGYCNGKPLNTGLYLWQAEIDLLAGKVKHMNGEVMLMR